MAPAKTVTEEDTFPCTLIIRIPFPKHRLANVALRALSVDAELSPLVRRSFSLSSTSNPNSSPTLQSPTNGNGAHDSSSPSHTLAPVQSSNEEEEEVVLVTHYSATTDRMLRVAVNGFFESVGVVISCMRELDVDVVDEPWIGTGNEEVDALRRVQGLQERGTIS